MFTTLLSGWRRFLLRKLDIREGEYRRVGLMQLNVFLLIQSLWIIKPVVNAQFLSRVGIEKLPSAFLMVALTALVVSITYSRWLRRLPLGSIMYRTYLVSILALLLFAFLMYFDLFQDWMSYVFYIGIALFGLVTTSQFWLLGNHVFSSLEAKRLFGFIGAGAIAGGISGGYVTSTLAPLMDSENLLFVAVGLLTVGMLVNQQIWKAFVPPSDPSIQLKNTKNFHEYPFHLIRSSKHLTFLALIMGISVVVDKLVEFQFSSIASSRISNPDQLTAFFGFWFSTSNVISLIFQLLITQRLVAFLGVGRSLFVFPGALFTGTLMVLNTPVLWAGTTLKAIDISLKQSINKAATELLILPIPMAIKSQAKTFIDVFVDTTATGAGGIILIFIINGFHLSVRAVCLMILLLIGLWIYFAIRVRKEYINAFQANLGIRGKAPKRKDLHIWDADVVKGIRRSLVSGSVNQIVFLLSRIEESKNPALMPDIIHLLDHESPKIRQAALRCLYFHTDHSVNRWVEPLLKDPVDEVRSRAFSCLLAHTRQDRIRFIENYLSHNDPAISGAALVGLATESRGNPQLQKLFNLEQRILEKISTGQNEHELKANKIIVMRAIGYGNVKAHYPLLLSFMNDQDPELVKNALLAAGSSQDLTFGKILVTFLPNKSTRSTARKAIAKFEPSHIFPFLLDLSHDINIKRDILIQLPGLAKSIDTQHTIDYLFGFLRHPDIALRAKTLEVLYSKQGKDPHLYISKKRLSDNLKQEAKQYKIILLLNYTAEKIMMKYEEDHNVKSTLNMIVQILRTKREGIIKNIFLFLRLFYPPELITPLSKDIRSQDIKIRIDALELLDNILSPLQKKIVLPLVETEIADSLSEQLIERFAFRIPEELELYRLLLEAGDEHITPKVLTLIKELDQNKFKHLSKHPV